MKKLRTHSGARRLGVAITVALLGLCLAPNAAAQLQDAATEQLRLDPISITPPNPRDQYLEAYIEQKLDAQVPLNLSFRNEHGEAVQLGDYFTNRPVVLALVYYECPMLCNLILNGMVAGFDGADNPLTIGQDYQVVTVSIDPDETPEVARMKKENYLKQYHREGGEEGWHFLTGTEPNIEALAEAVGFRYYYDEKSGEYAHASGIMLLTPAGRVSSYYLGIEYLPKRLNTALIDAGRGTIGSLVDQLILLCFSYDPTRGSYGLLIFNVLRLSAGLTVLSILAFWLIHYLRTRRMTAAAPETGPEHA